MQVKFGKEILKFPCLFCLRVTVSFPAVEFTMPHRVGCFTKGRPFISEVNMFPIVFCTFVNISCLVKIGIYKQIGVQ